MEDEAYILSQEQYEQLIAAYEDGYELWGPGDEPNTYIVNIWDDAILKMLHLGAYSGGSIVMNPSEQGGPM